MKTVYVGLSGGVDSSVAAALLKEQGYRVVGVHMKNWTVDFPGFKCPWKEDYQDAKRVAVQLGIDFKLYDFQKQYKKYVVDYMIKEYEAGRTPNPDIKCNEDVKFKLFFETALADGADFIATGHYARIGQSNELRGKSKKHNSYLIPHTSQLLTAVDSNKDQTYFLYRVNEDALEKTLFPIGDYEKPEVRKLAEEFGLITAKKKDSQGICFVGEVGIKEFLSQYVKTEPGNIVDNNGKVIGQHDGAIFYTIGQRHGLNVGGGLPYYVTGKDMKKNEVYVTTDLDDENLWHKTINLTDLHWINGEPSSKIQHPTSNIYVRTRHRAPLIKVKSLKIDGAKCQLELRDPVRALTPGQSAVLYEGERVIGGGIVV